MNALVKAAGCGAVLSVLAAGCAGAPRKAFAPVPPPPGEAAVYFYRPSEMTAMLRKPQITADGASLGWLANDSYGVAFLPPGKLTLRSKWAGLPGMSRDDEATVDAAAGKSYYLRVRYHVGTPRQVTPSVSPIGGLVLEDRAGLEEVPEAEAAAQMAGMTRANGFAAPAAP